jgi:mono/diheme cytochrome c family protein
MKNVPSIIALAFSAVVLASCSGRRSEPFGGPLELTSERLQNGHREFMEHCNKCHPMGEAGLGPALNPNPAPRFVKALQIRWGLGAMPHFSKKELSRQDVRDITLFMKKLRHNTK